MSDPNSSSSFQVIKMVQTNLTGSIKRTNATKQGNFKKNKGSTSVKEQQQIVSQPKYPDSSRLVAPAASTGIIIRPTPGSMQSLKQSSQANLPSQQQQKTLKQSHTSSVQRISQDRIRLINNQIYDLNFPQGSQAAQNNNLPYVPQSQIQVGGQPKKVNSNQQLLTGRNKLDSRDSSRHQMGSKSGGTYRKQHSSKLQSRKSSNTIAPGSSAASENLLNSKNAALRGHIITFDERQAPQDEADFEIMQSLQVMQPQVPQVQSLQTIHTERDIAMGGREDSEPVYDFLPDNRSIQAKAKQNALLSETQRDLRTYSTNAKDASALIAYQWTNEFQNKFNELRQEFFKEIDMINMRLQNLENSFQTQRGRQYTGIQENSPGLNGYGTVNMTGFADTVKVTFSNTKADADNNNTNEQVAVNTKVKTKKGKKKKKTQEVNHLEENEEDSEIGDIQNFFQVPTNEHLQANNKLFGQQKAKKDEKLDLQFGKDEHIRRSMREIRNRKPSNKIQGTAGHPKSVTPIQPEFSKAYGEDLLNMMNFDIKSPIQQELRLSKVASQERITTSNYMLKEKGQITSSQQQQIRVMHHREQASPVKQTKSMMHQKSFDQQQKQQASKQQIYVAKASSSLSQSRKEKIIELNQKLLKSPNIVLPEKKSDQGPSMPKEKTTQQLLEENKNQQKPSRVSKMGAGDLEYKNFLENDEKQVSNNPAAQFGTFGGKNKQNQGGQQLTEGPTNGDTIIADEEGKLNLVSQANSELQTQLANTKQRISLSSKKGFTESSIAHKQPYNVSNSLHQNMHQKISNQRLLSSSTFSNGEIDNGGDDFDEKMDQRQYNHNISQKSNLGGHNASNDADAHRLSNIGPNLKNGHIQRYQIADQNDDDDDDGGFLSDEVDERRSYTPPPRGISTIQGDLKENKSINNVDISTITIDNDGNNAINIMNLSKMSKANQGPQPALKTIQKNPSTMLPSSGQNLLAGASKQNPTKNSFMGQPMIGAQSQIYQQHNNLMTSGNNSFISGTQNMQIQVKKPQTALNSVNRGMEFQNEPVTGRSGTGSSMPLTARVNNFNNIGNTVYNQSNEPRVKSLQRQPIIPQTESKSGINTIYKSPVRNIGGTAAPSLSKPRSAYGGDAKQSFVQNGNFGQVFIQNLRDLSGVRQNTGTQGHTSRIGDTAVLSTNEIIGFNGHNQSRQSAQNQMAQNLKKTPGTSMGLMTSVKTQNGGQGSNGQTKYTANSFNHNLDYSQGFMLQGNTQQQSQSFKHNLHALMAQKGSKCKCNPQDFVGQENDQPSLNNIFTRNEELHMTKNEQEFDEISMGSVGAGSEEVDDAAEHRPSRKPKQKAKKKKFCSSYCKRIGPKEQRQIILECLRIEVNEIDQGQVTIFKGKEEDEQSFEIKCSFNKLQRYIIDAKWWAKWCDYSNFDQNDILLEQLDFNQKEERNTLMRQFSEQQLQNYLSAATNRKFESTQLYQKPPRIENEGLLEQRNFEGGIGGSGIDAHFTSIRGLRENLTQHYDFEALYPSMWLHLYSWYSADTQIARYLKIDSFNQEDMLGSMGSTTLKQALAEGEFKDQNGKNKFKKMELDLYPSKLNSKAFKNQFYHFDDYNPGSKDDVTARLNNSESRKNNNTGPVNTEPTTKEGQQTQQNANNNIPFGFNLSGFNKMINAQSQEKQEGNTNLINKPNLSPTGGNMGKKGKSFVDKRPSLQGLLNRQQVPESAKNLQYKQSQVSGLMVGGARPGHTANNSEAAGPHLEFQQKRNSYSFNRQEQQRISPQNDIQMRRQMKVGGTASSTSPIAVHRGQSHHQKSAQEEVSAGTSIGQRLMSYFNQK